MEITLKNARQIFLTGKLQEQANAIQRASLQIIVGIDIDTLKTASLSEQRSTAQKLKRLIERERIKGLKGHWSYDLNRHIALKQTLDQLERVAD